MKRLAVLPIAPRKNSDILVKPSSHSVSIRPIMPGLKGLTKMSGFIVTLGLLFPSNRPAFALSSRSVFEGDVNRGIDLKVWPGYGLTINLLPTHAIIKQAWLGHPGRFLLSSNGSLCPQSLQGQSCKNRGASVLLLRLIDPKTFNNPDLLSSADGSTQITLIVQEPNGDEQELQFGLLPAQGKPEYTSLQIYPDSEKPTPVLPLAPARQDPVIPRTTSPGLQQPLSPRMSSELVSEDEDGGQGETDGSAVPLSSPVSSAASPTFSPDNTAGPLGVKCREETTNCVVSGSAVLSGNIVTPPTPPPSSPVASPSSSPATSPPIPPPSSLAITDDHTPLALAPNASTPRDFSDKQGQPCVSSVSSLKNKGVVEGCPCLSGNVVTPSINLQSADSHISSSTETTKEQPQSTENATAFAFGLLAGIQSGQIQLNTPVWEQAQETLFQLRRGQSIASALSKSKLSLSTFNEFLTLGQQTSPIVERNIPSVPTPENTVKASPTAPTSLTRPQINSKVEYPVTTLESNSVNLDPSTPQIGKNFTLY